MFSPPPPPPCNSSRDLTGQTRGQDSGVVNSKRERVPDWEHCFVCSSNTALLTGGRGWDEWISRRVLRPRGILASAPEVKGHLKSIDFEFENDVRPIFQNYSLQTCTIYMYILILNNFSITEYSTFPKNLDQIRPREFIENLYIYIHLHITY